MGLPLTLPSIIEGFDPHGLIPYWTLLYPVTLLFLKCHMTVIPKPEYFGKHLVQVRFLTMVLGGGDGLSAPSSVPLWVLWAVPTVGLGHQSLPSASCPWSSEHRCLGFSALAPL